MHVLISHLNSVSSPHSLKIAELAASILAKIATSTKEQNRITDAGALEPLIRLLEQSHFPRLQESVLEAIASLCLNNYRIVSQLTLMKGMNGLDPVTTILSIVRNGTPSLKLYACAWYEILRCSHFL